MPTKIERMPDYGPYGRPRPKREIIVELDGTGRPAFNSTTGAFSENDKILQTPLSDAKGLVNKKMLTAEKTLCQS
ncbi:MAG: hypothetical protein U0Y10_02225 [Spirosomataceae bacterium]